MDRRYRQSATIVLIAAAACGDGSHPMTLDEYHAALTAAEARRLVCRGVAAVDAPRAVECLFEVANLVRTETEHVAAAHAAFDPAQAASCVAQLKALIDPATCWGPAAQPIDVSPAQMMEGPPFANGVAPCRNVFTGRIAAGGSCDGWWDCAPGLCGVDGKCVPTPGLNEPCYDGQCAPDLGCSAGRCVAMHQLGESCGPDAECIGAVPCVGGKCVPFPGIGESCSLLVPCQRGLSCGPDSTCHARLESPLCYSPDDCSGNQICVGQIGSTPGTCAVPQDVGGACIPGIAGLGSGCAAPLLRSDSRTCIALPGPGEPCFLQVACDPYVAYCAGSNCQMRATEGEPCSIHAQCQPPLFCDPEDCVPTAGGACTPTKFACHAASGEPRICPLG
jgi:hypothetical protein